MQEVDLMLTQVTDEVISKTPALKENGLALKNALHQAILSNDVARSLADLLHGIWLGHPLHPLLTDIPIGAWTFATLFDGLALLAPNRRQRHQAEDAADALMALGVISAVPTAIAGAADYSAIDEDAVPIATLHGLFNAVSLVTYLASVIARRRGHRETGVVLGLVGMGLSTFAAWLGGEMVYRKRVGVNHAETPTKPETWTAVLPVSGLAEAQPKRIEVEGQPVLLYRRGGTVYALLATCSHAGGPLDEGKFYDGCVQCPWHDSVFELSDGHIVHGPATTPQPTYRARIEGGQVELRVDTPAS